jgi:hypothetical protein
MVRNPSPEPGRLRAGFQAIAVGAAALALVEIARRPITFGTLSFGSLGAVRTIFAVLLALLVVVTLHHGLVWTLVAWTWGRFGRRVATLGSVAIALAYGWLWQRTVTSGDGLAASDSSGAIRASLGLGIPLALAAVVGFVFWPGRLPALVRTLALAALLAGALAVTLFVLPEYRAFHGLLGGFEVAIVALLVANRRATRPLALAIAALGVLAVPLLAPRAAGALGTARRYARLPGTMLESLPVTRALLPDVRLFVEPSSTVSPARRPEPIPPPGAPRGDSAILVVLEATRSDTWADPSVAPEFSRWKRHGLYVPRAVSQYPATPLAYGAIFTSHPPSVVAQSPHWAKHHLFDLLVPRFRNIYMSQPAEPWFGTGAMTSFITKDPSKVRRHETTDIALAELRRFLEGDAGRGSFFAWTHLFDPHRPWKARGNVSPKAPPAERYRSEVRAVDGSLGAFMRWFYEQPFASRTLVMVIGDHGEAMGETIEGEPFYGHHVHVADAIAHVPFYASGPGVPAGVIDDGLAVCQLDVMPTLFEHLGATLPERLLVQGLPLTKLLTERPVRSLPTEAFSIRGRDFFDFVQRAGTTDARAQRRFFREMWESGTYPPKLAIQRGDWKLVRDAILGEDALYDLRADPRESRDVSRREKRDLASMQRALAAWTETQAFVLRELERLD